MLNSLLSTANTRTYNLRQRSHNRTLVAKTSSLTGAISFSECCTNEFIDWSINLFFVISCGLSTSNKDYDDDDDDDDDDDNYG